MKIAIPTDDGISICGHFGRTKGFKIFEVQNKKVVSVEDRVNDFTGHAMGHHDHQQGEHNSHSGILTALNECKIVIANGMGRRLYDDLQNANIQVFVTNEKNINNAVNAFIDGNLDHNDDICCSH